MKLGYEAKSRYYGTPCSSHSPEQAPGKNSKVSLTVLFTTVSGTLDALRKAAHWTHQLEACIHVLVPYSLPIDKPSVDPKFRLRQFHTLCGEEAVETRIDIRLCRDARQCIYGALPPNSLILIGGRQSCWPLTFEKRLARSLKSAGHQVVFIGHREGR